MYHTQQQSWPAIKLSIPSGGDQSMRHKKISEPEAKLQAAYSLCDINWKEWGIVSQPHFRLLKMAKHHKGPLG